MSVKLHIKKGDMVYVNAGDNKGQQGKVLEVDPTRVSRVRYSRLIRRSSALLSRA